MKKTIHLIAMLALVAVFGLSSCTKEEDRIPTGYTISSLELNKITNNNNWDLGSGPDIFFKILNKERTTLYYTSNTRDDVNSLPISWSNMNCPLKVNTDYIVSFLDEDTLDDEVMANCLLNVYSVNAPRQTYTWTSSDGKISFTLHLTWNYN